MTLAETKRNTNSQQQKGKYKHWSIRSGVSKRDISILVKCRLHGKTYLSNGNESVKGLYTLLLNISEKQWSIIIVAIEVYSAQYCVGMCGVCRVKAPTLFYCVTRLRVGRAGVRMPSETGLKHFFSVLRNVQTETATHMSSYSIGDGRLFLCSKAAGV